MLSGSLCSAVCDLMVLFGCYCVGTSICNNGQSQSIPAQLGGQTLAPGCYKSEDDAAFGLTGTLVLRGDGQFVFNTPAALTTAASR